MGDAPEVHFGDAEMSPEYEGIQYASIAGPSSTLWTAMGHDQEHEMAAETLTDTAVEVESVRGRVGERG